MSGETKRLNPKASTLNPGRSRALNVLWHVKCSRKTLNPGRKHAPEEVEEEFIDYQQVKTHMTCQEGLGCLKRRVKRDLLLCQKRYQQVKTHMTCQEGLGCLKREETLDVTQKHVP